MTNEELNTKLEQIGLTKKEFAELVGADHRAVYNWNNEGRGVPYWVDSWLDNYAKSKAFDIIADRVDSVRNRA